MNFLHHVLFGLRVPPEGCQLWNQYGTKQNEAAPPSLAEKTGRLLPQFKLFRRLPPVNPSSLNKRPSAAEQLNKQYNKRDDEQDMNIRANRVKTHQTN
jgi:hypothetical protein